MPWLARLSCREANYKNVIQGIDYTPIYLERFFRNLLLDDKWDLRNRYLHIHTSQEWKEQPNSRTDKMGQVRDKFGTSSGQVAYRQQLYQALIEVIGNGQLSVRMMMEGVGLKGRNNFLNSYLNPAIQEGYVCLLYPQSPRHPRQKYLLTVKGLSLWSEINK